MGALHSVIGHCVDKICWEEVPPAGELEPTCRVGSDVQMEGGNFQKYKNYKKNQCLHYRINTHRAKNITRKNTQ